MRLRQNVALNELPRVCCKGQKAFRISESKNQTFLAQVYPNYSVVILDNLYLPLVPDLYDLNSSSCFLRSVWLHTRTFQGKIDDEDGPESSTKTKNSNEAKYQKRQVLLSKPYTCHSWLSLINMR